MKRFKFTLQALYDYKLTVEKMQLAELRKAQQALRELLMEKERLDSAYHENERSLENALRLNENIVEALALHDHYFRYLRDAQKELELKIIKAEEERDRCVDQLVVTMRELKTYEKLRKEQYRAYLKEVQAEEEKEIGDIVSFNTVSEIN